MNKNNEYARVPVRRGSIQGSRAETQRGRVPLFDEQIFIDEKPPYYDFANETKNMTGAEVFSQFAPGD